MSSPSRLLAHRARSALRVAALAVWVGAGACASAPPGAPVAAGEVLSGRSESFTFTAPEGGWSRLAPGSLGSADSDIELIARDHRSKVVAYLHRGAENSLDTVVAGRRAEMRAGYRVESIREDRSLLPGTSYLAASTTRYVLVETRSGQRVHVWVRTARSADGIVEVIALTLPGEARERSLRRMLSSLRVRASTKAAGPS